MIYVTTPSFEDTLKVIKYLYVQTIPYNVFTIPKDPKEIIE